MLLLQIHSSIWGTRIRYIRHLAVWELQYFPDIIFEGPDTITMSQHGVSVYSLEKLSV